MISHLSLGLLCLYILCMTVPTSAVVDSVYFLSTKHPNAYRENHGIYATGAKALLNWGFSGPGGSLFEFETSRPIRPVIRTANAYIPLVGDLDRAKDEIESQGFRLSYIYQIHASDNIVSVDEVLQQYSPHLLEDHFAGVVSIPWSQVQGYTSLLKGGEWRNWTPNQDYDPRYNDHTVAEGQYELALFPPNHPAWRQDPWNRVENNPCGFS